ncbi:response regulator [Pseudomonas sp. dw_358]|uniref:response regulator n=1 Tax=Pseudomonas sp. dw_358 TaxID=2720083 RepID=UPI001BD3E145|nr:response regulator [Pseudomonas sp. dw_358]
MTLTSMERPQHTGGLILVVEDEPIIRDFVCEILQGEGFTTHPMENADQAMAFLEAQADQVGLLLTDIRMPGSIDGAELSNRSGDQWPQIPILVMSGHETPESSGVKHVVTFIRKPWTIGQMIDGVEKALGLDAPTLHNL